MPTWNDLQLLCPLGRVIKDRNGGFTFSPFISGDVPVAPLGYVWYCEKYKSKSKTERYRLCKYMTQAEITRRLSRAREPWREYFPYRPNDMPSKKGNPAALAKLLAECGEPDSTEEPTK